MGRRELLEQLIDQTVREVNERRFRLDHLMAQHEREQTRLRDLMEELKQYELALERERHRQGGAPRQLVMGVRDEGLVRERTQFVRRPGSQVGTARHVNDAVSSSASTTALVPPAEAGQIAGVPTESDDDSDQEATQSDEEVQEVLEEIRWRKMPRTDAVEQILVDAGTPLDRQAVAQALHDKGRRDGLNAISATLSFLRGSERIDRVRDGRWVAKKGGQTSPEE